MSDAEFDRHARSYAQLHEQNIAVTGEAPQYFADYKMRDFRALVDGARLPADGRYLDFGCGVGASVQPFGRHLPSARLVCTDVSSESLELARSAHGPTVDFRWMKGSEIPLESGSVDGAFACCVFHHIPHDQHPAVLRELKRVLRPGGLLMVYEHNPFNPLTVRAVRTCPFDENAVLITARKLERTGCDVGLRTHKVDFRVFFPAPLAALRPAEDWLRWLPLGAQYFVAWRA